MIATIWEVYNDRHGDFNKGADVVIRVIYLIIDSLILRLIFQKPFLDSLLLSTAIFFFFFDYAITYVLIKNGTLEPPRGVKYHWFSYMGKVGVFDNLAFWRKSPWLRFGIKLAYLIATLIIFLI